jgi:hypothetical protein
MRVLQDSQINMIKRASNKQYAIRRFWVAYKSACKAAKESGLSLDLVHQDFEKFVDDLEDSA